LTSGSLAQGPPTKCRDFTIVALVVLTLGIGATTAIFSVVDAVVLRGLPFDEHERLVAAGERRPPRTLIGRTFDAQALSSLVKAASRRGRSARRTCRWTKA